MGCEECRPFGGNGKIQLAFSVVDCECVREPEPVRLLKMPDGTELKLFDSDGDALEITRNEIGANTDPYARAWDRVYLMAEICEPHDIHRNPIRIGVDFTWYEPHTRLAMRDFFSLWSLENCTRAEAKNWAESMRRRWAARGNKL